LIIRTCFILAAITIQALSAAPPTYNSDIAPILNSQCARCHRPGEVAPFSLLTYQDAAKRAALIARVTTNRYMPPWKPVAGFAAFQHERRLTPEQIALIAGWARAGAPEGNPKDKPAAPVFADGWQGGEPNLVIKTGNIKTGNGFNVPAEGHDIFQCFVLPLNLKQGSYIQTAEFHPGNRSVVHHAVIYVDETGTARQRAASSPDGSYPCFGGPGAAAAGLLTAWAPGTITTAGDPQLSVPVMKGTDLILQIHYHPTGKTETDISSVGVTFSGPPAHGRTSLIMVNPDIDIPPGDSAYVVKSAITLPRDVEFSGIFPHAHWLCKDMKIDAHLPNGEVTHMLWIKDWDFNWQGDYSYDKPIRLPKGTRVEMQYTFDNSAKNIRNPSKPPVRVRFGEQTTDEMAYAVFTVVLPTPADVAPFQRDMRLAMIEEMLASGDVSALGSIPGMNARAQMLLRQFDKNGDGKFDASERAALMDYIRSLMR